MAGQGRRGGQQVRAPIITRTARECAGDYILTTTRRVVSGFPVTILNSNPAGGMSAGGTFPPQSIHGPNACRDYIHNCRVAATTLVGPPFSPRNLSRKAVANARRNYTLIKLRSGVRIPPVLLWHCSSEVERIVPPNPRRHPFRGFLFKFKSNNSSGECCGNYIQVTSRCKSCPAAWLRSFRSPCCHSLPQPDRKKFAANAGKTTVIQQWIAGSNPVRPASAGRWPSGQRQPCFTKFLVAATTNPEEGGHSVRPVVARMSTLPNFPLPIS